jgi:hypothetical protein
LENSDYEDAIRISYCPNPEANDGDTLILVNINQAQFYTIILVHCNKCSNLTNIQWIQPRRHAFESSAYGDELQNLGNTCEDTAILVSFIVGVSITTSQYTWRRFQSVSIDKQVTEIRYGRIENDTHITYV